MNSSNARSAMSDLLIVIAFAISIFFVRFDGFIVNLAMPTFVKTFGITVSQASWVALSYILAQVCAVMFFGKLCDRFNLKTVFVWGLFVFVIGSLLCGLAGNFRAMIAFRCLQGLGGSLMLVSAYAAISFYLPREKVGWGLGIMTTSAALGVLLGPVVGGWIVNDWSWRWLFWINVPLGILAIMYCRKVIPNRERPDAPPAKGLDYAGTLFSAVALLLVVFALNMGREFGWTSWLILGSLVSSAVFFLVFYRWEKKCLDPLLDMRLFDNRSFTLTIVAMLVGFLMFFGGSFLMPFYLTQQGVSPKSIGFLLAVFSVVYIPVGLYSGILSDRVSPRKLVCGAMLLSAVTGLMFALTSKTGGIWSAVLYLVLTAVSYGMFFSPINHLAMSFAGEKNRGSISAVYNTVITIAMALGVVLLETVFSEFDVSREGFTAAYCVGGFMCLVSSVLLGWFVKEPRAGT